SLNQTKPSGSIPATTTPPMFKLIGEPLSCQLSSPLNTGGDCHSSQPMDGGIAHAWPSMSIVGPEILVPAPRQGEPMDTWMRSPSSWGSIEMLPTPGGSGPVHEKLNVQLAS